MAPGSLDGSRALSRAIQFTRVILLTKYGIKIVSAPCSRASHANYGLQRVNLPGSRGIRGSIFFLFCIIFAARTEPHELRVLEASGRPIGDPRNEEADELSKRVSVFGYQSEEMVTPACRLKYSLETLWWSRKRTTTLDCGLTGTGEVGFAAYVFQLPFVSLLYVTLIFIFSCLCTRHQAMAISRM